MILSFADKRTEAIFNQRFCKGVPNAIAKVALRKLMIIDAASSLDDLRSPPGNHLESLSGNREGQWSIRVNDQWRILFVPVSGGTDFRDVQIIDYHK